MTGLGAPNDWTDAALGSESDESLDQIKPSRTQPRPMSTVASMKERSRPLSSATTGTIGTTVTIIRPNNFTMRFSGAPGHPVHPRHFLKEFRIAMRDLGMTSDKEQIEAFEDYLVVESPAEKWYFSVRDIYTRTVALGDERPWNTFQIEFQARFPGEAFVDPAVPLSPTDRPVASAIKCVKFRQNAAVSAYIKATWKMGPTSQISDIETSKPQTEAGGESEMDEVRSVKLGKFKPIATEETFELANYGIPNGAQVRFTSHVWGVGEYSSEEDQWFIHDATATKGADFRQSGTAFKGWFNHTGKFDL
ncbi:hypothetical protein D9619_012316 [Psilocybe cf. subviscida]|uniref:Uncharacterized protein n=1 Tax=Psilocybe cf. subviscida TaxID=2480587 RepID=A0A8H5ERK8_9AGAR|nr:hypothetical protein D9619_012316 [Psilocybe cf. subviscida]